MTNADDTILEFFDEHPIALPPAVVAFHVDFSDTHVRNRMRVLASNGLLEKVDGTKGYYTITERGRGYLHGDLDASDLDDE